MKLHSILFLIVFEFVNNYTNSKTNFYTTSKQLFANFKELGLNNEIFRRCKIEYYISLQTSKIYNGLPGIYVLFYITLYIFPVPILFTPVSLCQSPAH